MSHPNLAAGGPVPGALPGYASTCVSWFDDVPDADAGIAWHQEQFCEHAEIAAELNAAGRDLLAGQHWRLADWHRGQATELAAA
ncbi:MAG: hypothetical protein JHD16_00155 [Solirubrobacteraceae bacterium]|nr:hypothetical protein [Solirubrobacteraceae bacterium]